MLCTKETGGCSKGLRILKRIIISSTCSMTLEFMDKIPQHSLQTLGPLQETMPTFKILWDFSGQLTPIFTN